MKMNSVVWGIQEILLLTKNSHLDLKIQYLKTERRYLNLLLSVKKINEQITCPIIGAELYCWSFSRSR